jgi:hypothetical protein
LSSGFAAAPQYDPGLALQISNLREENAKLRHENEFAINMAQTWM